MTAPQQPAPTQDPAQAPVVQPVQPAPEGASGPAPDEDSDRAAIWPPPPEKWLEFMMDARYAIIEESGDGAADAGADRQVAPSPGTTPPAPTQQPQQPPVKE